MTNKEPDGLIGAFRFFCGKVSVREVPQPYSGLLL